MKFQLTENGVVTQVQPNPDEDGGFVECPDNVHCGMLFDGTDYTQPAPVPKVPPTNEEIYDQTMQNSKVIKGLVLALNDGSIVPGTNMTNAALKAAIKAKM